MDNEIQKWIPLQNLGERGLENDLLPQTRAPNSLDYALNVRYVQGDIQAAGGYSSTGVNALMGQFNTFFPGGNTEFRDHFYCSEDKIYKMPNSPDDLQDITGDPITGGTDQRWSGGWLNGGISFCLPAVAPRTFRLGTDPSTQKMVWNGGPDGSGDTWEDMGNSAQVMRPFRDYMVAANLRLWNGTKASTKTGTEGADNAITWTANGINGNDITIEIIDPGAPDQYLYATLNGRNLTVNLGTDSNGNNVSDANKVIDRINNNGNDAIRQLITCSSTGSSDGTGIVQPVAQRNLTGGVDEYDDYPWRVAWCDPVEPGQVPEDWVTRATNQAGDNDIGWSNGFIVDLAVLGEYMYIFSENRIDRMEWVGLQSTTISQIFAFKEVTRSRGIEARDCVQEYKGFLYCQGTDDIYRFNGSGADGGVQSLIWGRIKKQWLADRDRYRCKNNWVTVDLKREEIIFAYVSYSADAAWKYPNKAVVLNMGDPNNLKWAFRDYGVEMPFAEATLDLVENIPSGFTSSSRLLYAIDRTNTRQLVLEEAFDREGAPVVAQFGREGLILGPTGHVTARITDGELLLSGASAQVILTEQSFMDGPQVARNALTFDPTTQEHIDLIGDAIQFGYNVSISASTDWKANSLSFKVQLTGDRRG